VNQTVSNELRQHIMREAFRQLQHAYGEEKAKETAGRVALGFLDARNRAKSPDEWDRVAQGSPDALLSAVATSCQTGLYPGGPNPTCYLVPQGGRINWRITHRGVCTLAVRAGYHVDTVPVHKGDDVTIEFGEVTAHTFVRDPMSLDDLAGVIVVVRRLGDPRPLVRKWVSGERILERKRKTRTGPVWNQWPVEMAQKTAILYVAARGTMPIEAPEWDSAVAADYAADRAEAAVIVRPAASTPAETLALPAPSFMDEPPEAARERETVQAGGGAA